MSAVWEIDGIDSTECLVLIALADHADDAGRCYPSIARLAKRTKLSDRGVQKVVYRLVDKGFLTVHPCAGQGGANLYVVTSTPTVPVVSVVNHVHPEPRSPRTTFTTPPNHVPKTPEPRSPKPSGTVIEPSVDKTKLDPVEILASIVTDDAAKSFTDFRKKIRKPLTATGAKRLSKALAEISAQGGDPSDALAMAEERGWQSITAAWYFKELRNAQPSIATSRGQQSGAGQQFTGIAGAAMRRRAAREQGHAG